MIDITLEEHLRFLAVVPRSYFFALIPLISYFIYKVSSGVLNILVSVLLTGGNQSSGQLGLIFLISKAFQRFLEPFQSLAISSSLEMIMLPCVSIGGASMATPSSKLS